MFEKIKCYKNLRKAEKLTRGIKVLGEITQNEEMVREANEALHSTAIIKKKMWFNKKMAKKYNLCAKEHGFI